CDEPFWNSSQTNFPRPGFCASISAAISTIQPTPSDSRRPVKISGSADGSTILNTFVNQPSCSTRPTFIRSLSMLATPSAVLINAGQSEHSVTVMAEFTNDFWNSGSELTYTALTTIVTIGNHASGDTGLKICTSGLIAALIVRDSPASTPSGTATSAASTKPV